MISYHLLKVLILTAISFVFALAATPVLTHFLYKYKIGKNIRNDGTTPIFSALHASKQGTPTMAGIIIWGSTLIIISVFWFLDRVVHLDFFHILNFLTRRETLLPLGAFIGAAIVGLLDDIFDLLGRGHKGRGFRFRHKVFFYAFVAAIGAYWFYFKLGFNYIQVPLYGPVSIGWLYIPFFILAVIGTGFAVNQTDGLDGLAGGTLLFSFTGYGIISYLQGRYELSAFIGVIVGALLAFLWFNIHPARFFMGDTGSMGLGTVLAVIAFLVHGELVLPIIGFVFVLEAVTTILQLVWRRFFHKKIFLTSPIHHHLQARGWPESKVVMRFWIVSIVFALLGVMLYFVGPSIL
jgi:phospho-N-acetylmuramoyl-pentapeptide-transferase